MTRNWSLRPRPLALAVGYALVVLVVSVTPARGDPAAGPLGLVGLDLWLHVVGYALLAALLARAVEDDSLLAFGSVVAVTILYGGLVELAQTTVPTRGASLADLLADGIGAVVGALDWRGRRWLGVGDGETAS